MPWTVNDIPDLTGRTAVVTGANAGLGLEVARALAGAGTHVVMAARDQSKAGDAEKTILGAHPDSSLEIVEIDLGSLASVKRAAKTITMEHPRVDILVNNAGVMGMPERKTEDGFESQFGINHLGHWALTAQLMPGLLRADRARVVTVTSTGHHFGRAIDSDNPHMEGEYKPWTAYSNSKLANYHFALGLHRELTMRGLTAQSLVAHPGLSQTNLQIHSVNEGGGGASAGFWAWLARNTGMIPSDGALPLIRAATDPNARSGEMYAPRYMQNGPPVRRPILRRLGLTRAIETLWEVSERESGIKLDFDDPDAET